MSRLTFILSCCFFFVFCFYEINCRDNVRKRAFCVARPSSPHSKFPHVLKLMDTSIPSYCYETTSFCGGEGEEGNSREISFVQDISTSPRVPQRYIHLEQTKIFGRFFRTSSSPRFAYATQGDNRYRGENSFPQMERITPPSHRKSCVRRFAGIHSIQTRLRLEVEAS